jgi:hypothetical protein
MAENEHASYCELSTSLRWLSYGRWIAVLGKFNVVRVERFDSIEI